MVGNRRLAATPAVSFEGEVVTVPDQVAAHVLAVCREALSNIARHSGASAAAVTPHARIQVLLRVTDSAGALGEITPARGCGRSRLPLSAQGRPAPPDGLPFSLPRGELPPKERQAGQHAGTQQRRKVAVAAIAAT